MSLIHDALKKAQSPEQGSPKGEFAQFLGEATDEKDKKKSIRIIILAVVLVGSIVYITYNKFFSTRQGTEPRHANLKTSAAGDAQSKQIEARRLKGDAVRAFSQNRLDEAWIRLTTAGQLDPLDYEIWNNMGLISRRKGDMIKARDLFEKALQIKADCVECLNNLAVLDLDEGNVSQAREKLSKAMSINPNYADAAFHMAIIEDQQGETRLAIAYYKKFLELKKDAPQKLIDDVRRHVGDLETSEE